MKNILLIFAFLSMSIAQQALAQGQYETAPDPQTGGELYRGTVTFPDLSTFNWQQEGYKSYRPDSGAIAILKQRLPDYQLMVFLGTWCEDSHVLIPQLQKVLEAAGYPLDQVNMVAVDRAKTSPQGLEKQYNIQLVPTIIVSQDGTEKGRIVEMTPQPLEKELVRIIAQ